MVRVEIVRRSRTCQISFYPIRIVDWCGEIEQIMFDVNLERSRDFHTVFRRNDVSDELFQREFCR